MATIDESLSQLEKDVRMLKIEYEQYFGGGKSRPPTDIEWRIDTLLKRYGDRGADMNYTQRFRYSNLAQTYAKYREIFRKRVKQKEEGAAQRHFGAAAREIEAERARKKASVAAKSDGDTKYPFRICCADPEQATTKVEQLFAAFRGAKEKTGEDTKKLTIEAFQRFVRQKTDQIKKQQTAREVEYVVTIEGNQARLKAHAKS